MNTFPLVTLMLLSAATACGESYCSLTVNVRLMGPLYQVPVRVQESNGHAEERSTRGEPVRFCGLGIGTVSVTVGPPGCRQLVVRDIGLSWNEPAELTVVHDTRTCNVESIPVAACQMLLRFVDDAGRPLTGVAFLMRSPNVSTQYADDYGRIFNRVPAHVDLEGVAELRGYQSQAVTVPCISQNYTFSKAIALSRARPK